MSRCTPDLARSASAFRFVKRRSKLRRLRLYAKKRSSLARSGANKVDALGSLPTGKQRSAHICKATASASQKRSKAPKCKVNESAQPKRSLPEGPCQSDKHPSAKKTKAVPSQTDQDSTKGHTSLAGPAAVREQMHIRIEEDPFGDCPAPVSTFEELTKLPKFVLGNLQAHGMKKPMPIQAQALPLVLAGRDVIGLAQTGSGKTLAFLLPVPVHISSLQTAEKAWRIAPRVLILAPTRELAVQIADEADKVLASSDSKGIRTVCVYGGGDKRTQQKKLQWGVDVVVATPGRLLDFVEAGTVSLEHVTYFVLDEADRMLDMGFHDDVTSMVSRVRKDRQVLFFSATWSPEVQQLAQGLCRSGSKPVRISYGQGGLTGSAEQEAAKHQAREGIVQEVIVVDHKGDDHWERQDKEKKAALEKHLRTVLEASPDHKVLVFVSMKQFADEVSDQLRKCGFSADSMHGGKSQDYRLWVLDEFRKGKLRLLVCTDVIGRGIDIPSVSHVVIYEMGEIQDYIHRIGRTARGCHGKGHALIFFEYWEGAPNLAAELIDVLAASKQNVPEKLRSIADEVARGKREIRKTGWSKR